MNINNKDTIIVGIQKASDEYEIWLDQAELLVTGTANHLVNDPVAHTDCDFGAWFYSDGQQLSALSGFKEVDSTHQAFHQTYTFIYEGAKEVSDSESISELKHHLSILKNQSALSINKLEKMAQFLSEEGELMKITKNIALIESTEPELVELETASVQQAAPTMPENLLRQLKEQDLLQLVQEQQLTELELKQLENRQFLATQNTQQITQYQSLIEDEINQQLNDNKILEEANINDIFLGQQELSRIKEDILSKDNELEQLALVDYKLDQRKAEEETKERNILNDFESRQSLDKQDLIKLNKQRTKWERDAENMRQQLVLIEQDLERLTKKESQKQGLIDKSNSEKEVKLQELIQQSKLQDKLNGHKVRVKESKKIERKELEEAKSSKKQRLKQLEKNSVVLQNQKIDINAQYKNELRELEERQCFKASMIDKLEKDKNSKQQELKELVHQQSDIQQSLDQMDSPQADTEKVLEEV